MNTNQETQKKQDGPPVNGQIRSKQVRLIGDNGEQLGIFSLSDAIELASEKGMDVVQVNPNASPPVCKILNYAKFRYQQNKKLHESKKKQKQIHLKEIKLRPMTGEHDIGHKRRHAIEFLQNGDKVKVTIMFRGRELNFKDVGIDVLKKFYVGMEEYGMIDKEPAIEGRMATMIINPKS